MAGMKVETRERGARGATKAGMGGVSEVEAVKVGTREAGRRKCWIMVRTWMRLECRWVWAARKDMRTSGRRFAAC